jgi:hypothetical protein
VVDWHVTSVGISIVGLGVSGSKLAAVSADLCLIANRFRQGPASETSGNHTAAITQLPGLCLPLIAVYFVSPKCTLNGGQKPGELEKDPNVCATLLALWNDLVLGISKWGQNTPTL